MRRSSSLHSIDELVAREVSDSYTEVLAVGANIDEVIYVANNMGVLVPQLGDIHTVAVNMPSVVTTAGSITEVNVVAADLTGAAFSDIEDLGSIMDPVTVTPGSGFSNIETVADNIANVDTVGGSIAGVNTVAADIANVNLVASNIADIDAIVAQVIPNLAEILSADDNAALISSLYDQFDDRYLGSKLIAPVVDNDGNALLVGALYFDSILNRMREWNGAAWSDALTLTAGSVSTLTNKTLDNISNVVGADHVHYRCRNTSGSPIAVGTVVTAQGTQSGTDYIEIVPITNAATQIALGIVHTTVADNATGLVLNTGVENNLNTSAWPVGTLLYPNNSGGLTATKSASGWYQAVAVVLRQHINQGTLLCEFTEPNPIGSTTQAGYVQLNDTLTSTSTTLALTAAQGKVLQDGKLASADFTGDAVIALINADTDFTIDLGGLV